MKKAFFLLLLFFLKNSCSGQELSGIHYDVENGLPSSELYDVVQDKDGFIWIASDRGVSRFDGYTFTNFTMRDGLTDNTVFNIWFDQTGRIWFNTFNARLCYYEKGKFSSYAFNDSILKYTKSSRILRTLDVSPDGSLTLGYFNGGILKISSRGNVSRLMKGENNDYVVATEKTTGAFFAGRTFILAPDIHEKYLSYDFAGKKGRITIDPQTESSSNILPFRRHNGDYYFAIASTLYMATPSGELIQRKFDSPVIRMNEDNDSCLWISLRKGGVYRYKPNEKPTGAFAEMFYPDERISCVFEDGEHGFWMSTLKNGLYYIPSTEFRIFSLAGKMEPVGISGQDDSLLFIGAKDGEIYERQNGQWQIISSLSNEETDKMEMVNLEYDSIRCGLFASYSGLAGVKWIDKLKKINTYLEFYATDFAFNKDDVFISASNGVGIKKDGHFSSFEYHSRPQAIYCDHTGKLWVAGRSGLGFLSDGKILPVDTSANLLGVKMLCMTGFNDQRLVIGTVDRGIIIYDPANEKIKNYRSTDGLAGDIVNSVFVSGDGSVWAGTNNGLSHLSFGKGNKVSIQNYGIENGLPSSEILSVFVAGKEVWATTRKQVFYFNPDFIRRNNVPPPVYITTVLVNDSVLKSGAGTDFIYDKNRFHFSFVGINFRSRGKVRYRYEMEGLDDKKILTSVPEAFFLGMQPGEYCLRVWAINEDGVESALPASFSFVIHPPFWETTWFRLMIIGFILLLIAGSVYGIIRRIRKQNQLRENLLEYQQQALANQMNPHFIFNSLNAMQSYIVREDKLSATRYLSRFSRLMRMSLDHSRMKLVPFSQELNLINVYLELEAMRFGEMLNWSVELPPGFEFSGYMIPSMLIQPYIENAIRHGILNRENKAGKIAVRFIFENKELRCEVEDNGVGRSVAESKRDAGTHRSAGTTITAKRLRLICRSMGFAFRLKIIDLKDASGEGSGTIVIFNLPYLKVKDEN